MSIGWIGRRFVTSSETSCPDARGRHSERAGRGPGGLFRFRSSLFMKEIDGRLETPTDAFFRSDKTPSPAHPGAA